MKALPTGVLWGNTVKHISEGVNERSRNPGAAVELYNSGATFAGSARIPDAPGSAGTAIAAASPLGPSGGALLIVLFAGLDRSKPAEVPS
jgi:hypothetical protein